MPCLRKIYSLTSLCASVPTAWGLSEIFCRYFIARSAENETALLADTTAGGKELLKLIVAKTIIKSRISKPGILDEVRIKSQEKRILFKIHSSYQFVYKPGSIKRQSLGYGC